MLLIGGGGHCKSVLDTLLDLNEYAEIGIVDKKENIGSIIMNTLVVGCDEDLPLLIRAGYKYASISVGSVGDPSLRIRLYNIVAEIGYEIPFIIDKSAKVSKYAKIDQGVFIGKHCVVNAGAVVKKGAILNTGSIIEHDCQVGAFAHIAPGAVMGGEVVIGENTHVGANTTIKQHVQIGANSIIGMGSVVTEDIGNSILAYGNPCKEVKRL